MVNPIIEWTDQDVWEFLLDNGCESNPLYKKGFRRIGCIGCPMGGGKSQKFEFSLYPKYRENYVRAFDRMLSSKRSEIRKKEWKNGEDVMRWWVGDDPNQITLYDYFGDL